MPGVATCSHSGVGNLHPMILFDANTRRTAQGEARRMILELWSRPAHLTGELGVGLGKIKQMCAQFAVPELTPFPRREGRVRPRQLLNPARPCPSCIAGRVGRDHIHGQLPHPELPRF